MRHKDRRYLLMFGIFLLGSFAFYFYHAKLDMEKQLLKENILYAERYLDCICTTVDYLSELNGDWETGRYIPALTNFTSHFDTLSNVYAELFNENFESVSVRNIHDDDKWIGAPFNPTLYPAVRELLSTQSVGKAVIPYANPYETIHIHLRWRWVPTGEKYNDKMLMIVGVSDYSVTSRISPQIIYGIIALLFCAAVYILVAIRSMAHKQD